MFLFALSTNFKIVSDYLLIRIQFCLHITNQSDTFQNSWIVGHKCVK